MPNIEKVTFAGHNDNKLAARLDMPDGPPRAFALFAHCFTCGKDLRAAREIAGELTRSGIAVLRFDFTGLGASEGEFGSAGFSSNVGDLVRAAEWLKEHHQAPTLLIGHSLGGAAVLAATPKIEGVKGVVTIGAPADTHHVEARLQGDLDAVAKNGSGNVTIGGRRFPIEQSFIDDLRDDHLAGVVERLGAGLLVMHAPLDDIVSVDNAAKIFTTAKHPKSFVSLDKADHLLSRPEDARFAAGVIAGWAARYLPEDTPQGTEPQEHVKVSETGNGKFQQTVHAGKHRFFADEPESYGGMDSGPSPYDLLAAGLGACTTMTLRMYADRKGIDLGALSVVVSHAKVHMRDCAECSDEERDSGGRIDRFERVITVAGDLDDELREKVLEIADKCPVHRTLEASSKVATRLAG